MWIDPAAIEAARGLGMREREILRRIALPLALPIVMGGVRTSTVINVGVATLAALVGAGGLGKFIFRGIAMVDARTVLMGAVPAAVLALLLDGLLALIERRLVPKGLRARVKPRRDEATRARRPFGVRARHTARVQGHFFRSRSRRGPRLERHHDRIESRYRRRVAGRDHGAADRARRRGFRSCGARTSAARRSASKHSARERSTSIRSTREPRW